MRITWHGHSCFSVATDAGTAVFDPYEDGSVPGLAPLRLTADAVYCSHGHHDHCAAQLVTLSGAPFTAQVDEIGAYHDDKLGLLRGRNTIRVLHAEGMRVVHMGDIGHIPSAGKLKQLQGADVLMIPVGGVYTVDAKTAHEIVSRIQPRIVFPMHYRLGKMGYDVLAELAEYTAMCDNVCSYDTDSVEITPDTPAQTIVVKYNGK